MNSFKSFDLLSTIQDTLHEKNITKPTEIQAKTIPALLAGQSIVGVSETGSGKTLSYALPILHKLKVLENNGNQTTVPSRPRAAVIVPTRELGEQVSRVFKPFTHTTRLRVRTVLGGTTIDIAKRNVKGPLEILVATPGRLIQLMERNLIDMSDVQIIVFDEADQMLDPGFLTDATTIVKACAPDPQMVLFSATVPATTQQLMTKLFSKADVVRTTGSHKLVSTLKTINRKVVDGERFPILEKILLEKNSGGTVLFVNTRAQCDKVAELLREKGHECLIYRGEMDKVARRANLKQFREEKIKLLISTDLAARGLDVDHVGRVINYHLPKDVDNYLHRVGRTARAGRKGVVINLVTERDENLITNLKKLNLNEALEL
jgi:ATP-dependent RNA helicase RhlE